MLDSASPLKIIFYTLLISFLLFGFSIAGYFGYQWVEKVNTSIQTMNIFIQAVDLTMKNVDATKQIYPQALNTVMGRATKAQEPKAKEPKPVTKKDQEEKKENSDG